MSLRPRRKRSAFPLWPIAFLLLAWTGLVAMRTPIEPESEFLPVPLERDLSPSFEISDNPSDSSSTDSSPDPTDALPHEPIIVIDPGHGGSDPGAVHYGTYEKNVVLDIAKRLETKLRAQNIKTVLTRNDDRYVSFEERIQFATTHHATLFISLHCNAALVRANGIEVYWSNIQSPTVEEKLRKALLLPTEAKILDTRSQWLAERTLLELIDHTSARNRGAKAKAHLVTRRAPCPAILVECGFLSDRKERLLLTRADGQEKIATALAASLSAYLKETKTDPHFQILTASTEAELPK